MSVACHFQIVAVSRLFVLKFDSHRHQALHARADISILQYLSIRCVSLCAVFVAFVEHPTHMSHKKGPSLSKQFNALSDLSRKPRGRLRSGDNSQCNSESEEWSSSQASQHSVAEPRRRVKSPTTPPRRDRKEKVQKKRKLEDDDSQQSQSDEDLKRVMKTGMVKRLAGVAFLAFLHPMIDRISQDTDKPPKSRKSGEEDSAPKICHGPSDEEKDEAYGDLPMSDPPITNVSTPRYVGFRVPPSHMLFPLCAR